MAFPLLRLSLIGILLALTACTEEPTTTPEPPVEPAATAPSGPPAVVDAMAVGKAAWSAGMCVKCHGDDGTGGDRAPNLTDGEWLHCDGSVEGIRAVLVSGVSRDQLKDQSRRFAMNPATNLVPDDQLDALAEYVKSLSSP